MCSEMFTDAFYALFERRQIFQKVVLHTSLINSAHRSSGENAILEYGSRIEVYLLVYAMISGKESTIIRCFRMIDHTFVFV